MKHLIYLISALLLFGACANKPKTGEGQETTHHKHSNESLKLAKERLNQDSVPLSEAESNIIRLGRFTEMIINSFTEHQDTRTFADSLGPYVPGGFFIPKQDIIDLAHVIEQDTHRYAGVQFQMAIVPPNQVENHGAAHAYLRVITKNHTGTSVEYKEEGPVYDFVSPCPHDCKDVDGVLKRAYDCGMNHPFEMSIVKNQPDVIFDTFPRPALCPPLSPIPPIHTK